MEFRLHIVLTLPRSGGTKFNFCFAHATHRAKQIFIAHRSLTTYDDLRYKKNPINEYEKFWPLAGDYKFAPEKQKGTLNTTYRLKALISEIEANVQKNGIPQIVISKEEIGYNTINRRDEVAKQKIFTQDLVNHLKPVFLFRDPFALRASSTKSQDYRKRFLTDIDHYIDAYKNLYEHFKLARANTNQAFPVSIEYLGSSPVNAELALRKICAMWEIDFDWQMLFPNWADGIKKLAYTRKYEVEFVFKQNKTGLHDNAMKKEGFIPSQMYENSLPAEEEKKIRSELLPLYNQMIEVMRDDIDLFQQQHQKASVL